MYFLSHPLSDLHRPQSHTDVMQVPLECSCPSSTSRPSSSEDTDTSVPELYLAGIIPGVILSIAFILGIVLMARVLPKFISEQELTGIVDEGETMSLLAMGWLL